MSPSEIASNVQIVPRKDFLSNLGVSQSNFKPRDEF